MLICFQVMAGTAYATIEVMKMLMTLTCNVSGKLKFVKRPGAIISPGMLLAIVDMDDSGAFTKATDYTGHFDIKPAEPGKGWLLFVALHQ